MDRLFKRMIGILFIGLLILGSANASANSSASSQIQHHRHPAHSRHHHRAGKSLRLPYFSAISVGDDISVRIVGGQRQQSVVLHGARPAVDQVLATVNNGVLVLRKNPNYLSSPYSSQPYNPHVLAQIGITGPLNFIRAEDDSHVNASGIHSRGLRIITEDEASVNVRGTVALREIKTSSSRDINVQWVHSRHLIIRGDGGAVIHLAGVVGILDARLTDASCLRAQYLRAREVYVETRDRALAEVLPIYSLNAFAWGESQIFYFKKPRKILGSTQESGIVLLAANRR